MEDNDHMPEEQNCFCRASKGRKEQLLASKGMFEGCVKRKSWIDSMKDFVGITSS
jgi:hypothetical protein